MTPKPGSLSHYMTPVWLEIHRERKCFPAKCDIVYGDWMHCTVEATSAVYEIAPDSLLHDYDSGAMC